MLRTIGLKMTNVRPDVEYVADAQANRDSNCARRRPSVRKMGIRDSRVAIVGYGPSLAETWWNLAHRRDEFDVIWTVSAAHDYLIERGITPGRHTDTDFREHKVGYNKRWNTQTIYTLATQAHPSYLEKLEWHDVQLFHVVQPGGGTFDNRYYKSPVAFDAGLQAAQLAYELGYRQQEWFGLDASLRGVVTHAGPHGGLKLDPIEVEIAGKPFTMNDFLLRQALWAEEMLHTRPKMRVKIHGDGALKPFLEERGRCRIS